MSLLGMFTPFESGFFLFFIVLIIAVASLFYRERWNRKVVIHKKAANQILSEHDFQSFSPPMISQLIYGRGAYTRHITAGLLNLVRKQILTLNKDARGPTYYFSVDAAKEKPHSLDEKYLYDWILYEVGNDGVFYVDDLYFYTQDDEKREQFLHRLSDWEQTMQHELEKKKFIVKFPVFKKVLFALSILMILLGSGLIISSPFLSILYLAAGVTTFITMLVSSSRTHKGLLEYNKWRPFVEDLQTSSDLKVEDENKLTASFVYAIAFGLKDSYVKKFPIREATQLSLKNDQFPLYFAAGSGTTIFSLEGIKLVDDLEASLDQIVSPVGFNDGEGSDGSSQLVD
ncbi:hypothetical protein CR194_06995 [Salipaludibacillus keqinensis]|uniref:Predicted membrane protein YciQ-like C-terminal domain-containing protein n=1 Tax=Salipaludibacillus keqinensis TaxID=2045207 RepID=A0A323TRS0_9BACI|nr:DUF2207 domain-containing protein [Salipaludibacillus keqinensis]PYZ95253.1 hypothetical protein CR194_06995 [Salipaludibacillus keqinensis]